MVIRGVMRNLIIVFLFGVVVCFLQGCDPGAGCDLYLIPSKSYIKGQPNLALMNDFETAVHIIELFAKREGFHGSETSEDFCKDYSRHNKDGLQWIYIEFLEDKDIIRISVFEMPSFKLTEVSRNIWIELVRQFQSEFGNDRIKVDDNCIAAKDL